MKKVLILLLMLVLALGLCLTSCGGKDDAPETENKGDDIHSHEFGEWLTIKNPTCVENGERERSCECGEKQTETLYATGEHKEVITSAVAPTCTEAGLTEGKSCSVCKEVLIAQTSVDATGHTEVIDPAVAPSCTETGLTEGKHCSVCNEILVSQGVEPIIAHSYDDKYDESCNACGYIRDAECAHSVAESILGYDATCTEPGLTEGKRCTKCGEILLHQTSIEAKGHTGVITDYVAPTCTEEGLTAGKYCSVCDATLAPQSVIPMLDHDYKTEYSFDETNHWLECKDCGASKDMAEHQLSGDSICAVCNMMMPTEGIVYSISDDGKYAIVTGYTGSDKKIIIADTYQGLPVKTIYGKVFYENKTITSVIIPDSVITIGSEAFYCCYGLTSVVIPDSVTSIGNYAFRSCSSLTSVVIGDSVTSIGGSAFSNCSSLTSVVIGDSVTSIGDYAFNGCYSLTSVVIGDSVTSIGYCAFYDCSSLTSVVIGDSVTSIGSYAFNGCYSLSSVVIGDSVTSIGSYAFNGCYSLSSVVIPDSVTSIYDAAFFNCSALSDVYYTGTEEEWKAINVGSYNWYLTNAQIHYNYVPKN